MLERVPAAAESTAHFFLRSVEKPARSSRALDPRFWRNGADELESSAWWSIYLQRVRTVPQTGTLAYDDHTALSRPATTWVPSPSFRRHKREPVTCVPIKLQAQQNGITRRSYSVSTPLKQSTSPQVVDEISDVRDQSYEDTLEHSESFGKEQGKFTTRESNSKARPTKQERKHKGRQPHFNLRPTARSLEEDTEPTQSLEAFELSANSAPNWPSDGLVIEPTPQSHEQNSNDARLAATFQSARKRNGPSRTRYNSFDLGPSSIDVDQRFDHSFDLGETLEQELGRDGTSQQLTSQTLHHEPGYDNSRLPDNADPILSTQTDIHGGWQYSNSFSALVPEEILKDDTVQEIPAPALDHSIKDEIRLDVFESQEGVINKIDDQTVASQEFSPLPKPLIDPPLQHQHTLFESDTSTVSVPEPQPSDPHKARFNTLLRARTAPKMEQFDEAWSLFLSFDDQEASAPSIFRFLTRSHDSKHLSRALAAFNTIPRPRRSEPMYRVAMYLEFKRHQYRSATNIAFEANMRDFNILPECLAFLVTNLLWNSVEELLHRNLDARQELAQFAASQNASDSTQRYMLRTSELLEGCKNIPNLDGKVLSLMDKIRFQETAPDGHKTLLWMLCREMTLQAVRSPAVLTDITPQALLALLDTEPNFPSINMHYKALNTIFQLPERGDKLDLALLVYRNFRWRHPERKPDIKVVKELITICGEAKRVSVDLFDYLLDQFQPPYRPDSVTYQKIMTYCARVGDPEAVNKYLSTSNTDHGPPTRLAMVNPVIQAYAVTGNTLKAREQFDRLETEYNLVPNTVSWNMLMLAHVRSDDDTSAFSILEEMRQKGVNSNDHTYGQLLAVCAAHGDTEAALDILVDARDDQVQVGVVMINTLVETYLKNDNPQAALRFAMTVVDSREKKSLTRLFNSFVRFFAFKGEVSNIMKIRDLMARHDVAADGMTYAAMLTVLTSLGRSSEAMELLQRMHNQEKLPVTMFHYSIILHGFVVEGNRDMAALVLNEIKQHFPDVSAGADAAMSSLQARRDQLAHSPKPQNAKLEGLRMLAELLKGLSSPQDYISKSSSNGMRDAGSAESIYRETLIRALIRSGSYDSAAQLMNNAKHVLADEVYDTSDMLTTPQGTALAQMDIAMDRRDWTTFHQVFRAAFEKAIKVNSPISSTQTGYRTEQQATAAATVTSHGAKYSLAPYLNRYMEAMARQGRQTEMRVFFLSKLWPAGFLFTGRNWNKYVQVLCRSRVPKEQVQAFKVFEKQLRLKTQSWDLLARGKVKKKISTYLWQPYGQRNRPILQRQINQRIVKRIDELRINPERKIPTYTTAVHLASVLHNANLRIQTGSPKQFDDIRRVAPRTKKFIQYMPRLKDGIQGSILRNLGNRGDAKPRPRSERSYVAKITPTGLLGDQSPLDRMPFEFLEDVEEITGRSNVLRNLLKVNHAGRGRSDHQRTDLELGEMFTGQVDRAPIVVAKEGRLETSSETQRRITRQEQQKRSTFERLREDLRARQAAKDVHRPPLRAEPRSLHDENEEGYALSQTSDAAEAGLSPALEETRNPETRQEATNTEVTEISTSLSTLSVSQQLDRITNIREQRNRELEARRERSVPIPQLAVPFVDRRRLRRRLALGQRKQAQRLLQELEGNLSPRASEVRTAAAKRLEAYERSRTRRKAVLAYERDLKAGKRLDPFPKTAMGVRARRFVHGPTRIRFVADLGRKAKNYLVRRGELHDRRQRRVQTYESRGQNYTTRYDRIAQRIQQIYGIDITSAEDNKGIGRDAGDDEAEVDIDADDDGDAGYKPFSS